MSKSSNLFGVYFGALVLSFGFLAGEADAKGVRIVYAFPFGSSPIGDLMMDSLGNFYGTTSAGGNSDHGTAFKVTPKGKEVILHSFGDTADDASVPAAGVTMDSAGNLYGTTLYGGVHQACGGGCGAVFKIAPDGTETVVYSFEGLSDGAHPSTPLVIDRNGNLYGTAQEGGSGTCSQGCGVVFKITPKGKETVLYAFTGGADGAQPSSGLLVDSRGNFIGETGLGGSFGNGTIYKWSKHKGETVLYSFTDGDDGIFPSEGLISDNAGNLYGTTSAGGGGIASGTVFKLSPNGKESILHAFSTGSEGTTPMGRMVLTGTGMLVGTTSVGGHGTDCACGTIFEVGTMDGREKVLHDFSSDEGASPNGGLVSNSSGNIYGTTLRGGPNSGGSLFKIKS